MKLTRKKWLVPATILVVLLAAIPALASSSKSLVDLYGDRPSTPVQSPVGKGGPDSGQSDASKDTDVSVVDGQRMRKEPAPIDAVQINVAESAPPQYFVLVQYGLPSGCAKPGGYEVERNGNEIRIKVFILKPAEDVICTMIYGTGTYSIPLGGAFVSGQTYSVDVNGTVRTFVAQ